MVVKLFVGKYLSGVLGQKGQQLEFERREGNALPVVAHLPEPQIDFQFVKAENFGGKNALPALDAQTQAQLNYSQAIFDYLTAKAEYDRIVGKEK